MSVTGIGVPGPKSWAYRSVDSKDKFGRVYIETSLSSNAEKNVSADALMSPRVQQALEDPRTPRSPRGTFPNTGTQGSSYKTPMVVSGCKSTADSWIYKAESDTFAKKYFLSSNTLNNNSFQRK